MKVPLAHYQKDQRMTDDRILIGISGYAWAGKDTFADALVDKFGFTKMAFADPLRAMALAINPIITYTTGWGDQPNMVRYSDLLDRLGYDVAKKEHPEVRRFLQALGTEAGRKVLSDTLWVDHAMARAVEIPRCVIADMRFKNEANAVRDAGGLTIRVNRPGVDPANTHVSERDLDDWDFDEIVENDGTVEDLGLLVMDFMSDHHPNC